MYETKACTTTAIVILAAVFWLQPSLGNAKAIKVDCSKATINASIRSALPGDVLLVSGVCNENVVVPEEIDRVTLDGQGTATINGGPAVIGDPVAVQITGRGITIKRFIIEGARRGIEVISGGTATIDSNTIQNTALHGIAVDRGSSATIVNNVIQNNPGDGILLGNHSNSFIGFTGAQAVRIPGPNTIQGNGIGIAVQRGATAQIGFNTISNNAGRGIDIGQSSHVRIGGLSDAGPSGNIISGNASDGIRVAVSSSANIAENTITNNSNGHGIRVIRTSVATIVGNTINANTLDGIRVEENSTVHLDAVNNTSSNNGAFGLRCRLGAYASGSVGTLNGNSGQKSFGATLTVSTATAAGDAPWGPAADGDGTALSVTGGPGSVKINSEGCIDNTTP